MTDNAGRQVSNLEAYVARGDFAKPWGEREWVPASTPYLVTMRERFMVPFVKPGSVVMEIGSGGGRMAQFLWGDDHETILVDGTTASEAAIRGAFPSVPKTTRFMVAPDGRLPLVPGGSVDLVFCFDVAVHFPRALLFAYLETAARILKVGGAFVLHFCGLTDEEPQEEKRLKEEFRYFEYHVEQEVNAFLGKMGMNEEGGKWPIGGKTQHVHLYRKARHVEAKPPLFSIVTLTRDRREYLRATLDSLAAQSCKDWELVVVDDSREPWVADVLDEWSRGWWIAPQRIKLAVLPPGSPLAHKRNVSICMASGELIAQADDDDISLPGRLERMCVEFSDARLMLCSCDADNIGKTGAVILDAEGKARHYRFPVRYSHHGAEFDLPFHTTGATFRRSAAFAVGLYRPDWQENGSGRIGRGGVRIGEDFDFYGRIMQHYGPQAGRMIDDVLVRYRLHDAMLTEG